MALLTISGDPASRWEEVAHGAAQLLGFEFVTEARLAHWMAEEFGDAAIPGRAWRPAATAVLTRLATEHHLVVAVDGSEHLFPALPLLLRARILAPDTQRAGNLMLDQRIEKPEALVRLRELDAECKRLRKARFGRVSTEEDTRPNRALRRRLHSASSSRRRTSASGFSIRWSSIRLPARWVSGARMRARSNSGRAGKRCSEPSTATTR